jgi:hypothetical protein
MPICLTKQSGSGTGRTAIKNDVAAIDRMLGTLGYTGDFDAEMPRQVSKARRALRNANTVRSGLDAKGNVMWSLRVFAR